MINIKYIIKKILRENLDNINGITPNKACEKIYSNTISEETNIIDEAAKQISDLSEDIGLFVIDNGAWFNFILYSKSEDRVYGVITTEIMEGSSNIQAVGRVAAEKGYGPLMYEMAMGYINPSYLMPSRDGNVRSEAWGVWKKFYQRKDISKKSLSIQDDLFSFAIAIGDNHDDFESVEEKKKVFDRLTKEERMDVMVFNTIYQYRNPMVSKLINNAKDLVKNKQVDISKLTTAAIKYFQGKYD